MNWPNQQPNRGMTLVEIMLALLLFGLLATFVIQVMDSVLNLWSAGERRGQGDLVFSAATERFRGDLQALHTGPRGWLIADYWEVAGTKEGEPAWRLPRLRFLANGAALPEVDASGRSAVEVMWAMIPEIRGQQRFGRLVRFAQVEDSSNSLQDAGVAAEMLRSGQGLVVMDGVLWVEFALLDEQQKKYPYTRVDAFQPFDFPAMISLTVEMVAGNARKHPPRLDADLGVEAQILRLRGTAPSRLAPMVLVDSEWIQAGGSFPNISFARRGLRETMPAVHVAKSPVFSPEIYRSLNALVAAGRRLP